CRRVHTRCLSDWSSDVCSSDLGGVEPRADARLAGVDQLHPLLELPCDLAGEGADLAAQVLLILAPLVTHALDLLPEEGDRRVGRSEERRVGKECSVR